MRPAQVPASNSSARKAAAEKATCNQRCPRCGLYDCGVEKCRCGRLATDTAAPEGAESDDEFWGRLLGDDDPAAPGKDWKAAAFNSEPIHLDDEPKCEGLTPFRCGNPSCPAHPEETEDA